MGRRPRVPSATLEFFTDESALLERLRSPAPPHGGSEPRLRYPYSILPFTLGHVLAPREAEPEEQHQPAPAASSGTDARSVLDVAVDRMVGNGPAAHQVWLPPLDVPDTLDELMADLVEDPRWAWSRRSGGPAAGSRCRSAPSTGRASSAATP